MNLLFCISFERWGGVHTWMLELGEALQDRGHRVFLSTVPGHQSLEQARQLGIETCDLPYGPNFLGAPRWIRFLRKNQIDLVMANTGKEIRTVGAAAQCLGLPVVQWAGLAKDFKKNTGTTRFERRYLVDRFFIEGESTVAAVKQCYPYVPMEKVCAIFPGKKRPPKAKPKEELQSKLDLNPAALNAVICSQHTKGKGHRELFEAVLRIRQEGFFTLNPFHIAVFHKGNETDSLTQFVVENGLQNYISMRGFQDDIPSLLPAFDLGLLPSHWEALANNLREYMWAGLCPMVSDIPGSLELVAHKQTGLVHATGNASEIADILKFALAEPVQVAQWGCAAREFAEEHLCMSACAQRLEIEFESLILQT